MVQGDEDNSDRAVDIIHIEKNYVPQLYIDFLSSGKVKKRWSQLIDKEVRRWMDNLEIIPPITDNPLGTTTHLQQVEDTQLVGDLPASESDQAIDTLKLRRSTRTSVKR